MRLPRILHTTVVPSRATQGLLWLIYVFNLPANGLGQNNAALCLSFRRPRPKIVLLVVAVRQRREKSRRTTQGEPESVRKLLSLGASPDPRNKQGLTPLIMAAARGCGPAVVHLVEAGADPGLVLSGGATVLHMSADMGLGEVGTNSLSKAV